MKLSDIMGGNGGISKEITSKLGKMTFVGIDFGTSTTTVTRMAAEDGHLMSVILPIPQESLSGVLEWDHLVPTVVAMREDGHLLFGRGAKDCLLVEREFIEGENVWSFCKMKLGESACYPKSRITRHSAPNSSCVIEEPKDVARLFFEYLKNAINEAVKKESLPPDVRYVVTVPASFAPNQREELCSAIKESGMTLEPSAILDEPNAAFLGAIMEHASDGGVDAFFRGDEPSRVLVFDFGAGTCDISVLKVTRQIDITNLAVSHFTALGGRDIDRKIAEEVLYPQLIADKTGDDVPVLSVKKEIVDALCPVAETMKIAICEHYRDDYGAKAFNLVDEEPAFKSVQPFFRGVANYGVLQNDGLELIGEKFAEIMRWFGEDPRTAFDNGRKSIFEPIDNALRKINFSASDIDFVLLVGGGCLNPFVTDMLEDYFPTTTQILSTGDLRILVAEGAAVHAIAYYGLKENAIHPITGDGVYAKTANGNKLVFPAGTPVPANWKTVDGLYIDDESASAGSFGIPFLCGDGNREIGIARFKLPSMERGCAVKLSCALSADKLLAYEICVGEKRFSGTLKMPLSSEDIDPREKEYSKAKNDLDRGALVEGGTPTVDQYLSVAEVCRKLGKYEEEAEYYRDLMYAHRDQHFEYEAARAYRDALKRKEALAWSRKACAYRLTYLNVWYIIWDLAAVKGWENHELGEYLERALASWPDDLDFKFVDMRCLEGCGQKEEAAEVAEMLCAEWEKEGVASLDSYTLQRFEIVARKCGRRDLCVAARHQLDMLGARKGRQGGNAESITLVRSTDEAGDGK